MKNKLLFIVVSILLFSCSEKPEEIAKENTPLEIESLFLNVTDSIDKTESLSHFQYQKKPFGEELKFGIWIMKL